MKIGREIGSLILQSKRVWHLLKRPSRAEFSIISKVSAIGILVMGAIGFLIGDTMKFIGNAFAG